MVKLATRLFFLGVIGAALIGCGVEDEAEIASDRYHVETTTTTLRASGVIDRNEEHLFVFQPPAGATIMSAELDGDGDADLYTLLGDEPTVSDFDCRPYVSGSQERCEHFDGRDLFVKVRGWAPTSAYELVIKVEGISTSP